MQDKLYSIPLKKALETLPLSELVTLIKATHPAFFAAAVKASGKLQGEAR